MARIAFTTACASHDCLCFVIQLVILDQGVLGLDVGVAVRLGLKGGVAGVPCWELGGGLGIGNGDWDPTNAPDTRALRYPKPF